MTRVVWVLAIALAAVGMGCMGTTHASRGSSGTPATAQAPTQPSQGQAGATADQRGMMGMGMTEGCPMTVPGTQVAATDTPDGEAMTFTTSSPDAVGELRSRVRAMADMHNQHRAGGHMGMGGAMQGEAGEPGMHGDMHAGGAGEGSAGSADASSEPGAGTGTGAGSSGSATDGGSAGSHERMMQHASQAVVEDVDGGARVTVTPEDPSDLQRLQDAVRSHVERMNDTGSCGMGGRMMPQGDAQQPGMPQPDVQQQGEEQKPQQ